MSSSHERKVEAYLKPTNDKLVKSYVQKTGVTKSAAVNQLLEKIPKEIRNQILKKSC